MSEEVILGLFIFAIALVILYNIYESMRINKILGSLKFRINTRLNTGLIVFYLVSAILFLYLRYKQSKMLELEGVTYWLQLTHGFALTIFCISQAFFEFKDGEIRDDGIYLKKYILKWKDIESYQVKYTENEADINIITNKISMFTKKNKEVYLTVSRDKLDKIKSLFKLGGIHENS